MRLKRGIVLKEIRCILSKIELIETPNFVRNRVLMVNIRCVQLAGFIW